MAITARGVLRRNIKAVTEHGQNHARAVFNHGMQSMVVDGYVPHIDVWSDDKVITLSTRIEVAAADSGLLTPLAPSDAFLFGIYADAYAETLFALVYPIATAGE